MANFRDNKFSRGGGGFRSGGGFRERPTMHPAVCDNCGKDCEVPFRPTSGKPIFCSSCFESKGGSDSRKSEGRSFERTNFEERKMFEAVCSSCGNNCKIPFQPRGDKPVYCSNCFENKGSNVSRSVQPQLEKQFEALNNKLDRILKLLAPNDFQKVTQEATVEIDKPLEESIEATPKKAKKAKKATPATE